jgi:dephospho-CoA kinase
LNSILHPLIRSVAEQRIQEHERVHPEVPAVTVIPLLHETGGESRFDSIACVASPLTSQMARLRQRGLDESAAVQRIRSQWPVEEKIKHSHIVLWNNGSLELLNGQLELLKRIWLSS